MAKIRSNSETYIVYLYIYVWNVFNTQCSYSNICPLFVMQTNKQQLQQQYNERRRRKNQRSLDVYLHKRIFTLWLIKRCDTSSTQSCGNFYYEVEIATSILFGMCVRQGVCVCITKIQYSKKFISLWMTEHLRLKYTYAYTHII